MWTSHHEHAAQIVRAIETHQNATAFMSSTCSAIHGSVGMGMGDNQLAIEKGNRGFKRADGLIGRGCEGEEHNESGVGVGMDWNGQVY